MQKSPLRISFAQIAVRPYAYMALLFFALAWFFPPALHAQFRGSLRGTVTDPQGAIIPGATVTLTNTDTNQSQTATTDNNGIYIFNGLPPAHFKLTVDAS